MIKINQKLSFLIAAAWPIVARDTPKGFYMLNKNKAVLVLIDVQGTLAERVDRADKLFECLRRLLAGMQVLKVPVIVTEQIPAKLGPTRSEFQPYLSSPPVSKSTFSCCREPAFIRALEATGRKQVILCGIETHVCVYQTALDLIAAGYEVHLAADAVSSRDPVNKELALRRMETEGVKPAGTEMILFELLGDAAAPEFKAILQIVK